MNRKRHFRGISIKLECKHIHTEATSYYRLPKSLVAVLYDDLIRSGVWCFECSAKCQPVELKGSVRL